MGRAKALSAKGLVKEAEIVLGNAVALDGAVKEPLFLLSCLVRQGQIQKALAQTLKYIGSDAWRPSQARLLSELTAALFLARPVPLAAAEGNPPARVEWFAAANAAREALAALTAQKPAIDIEPLIANIPARSAFGPIRLIIKGLLTDDPAKARRLLNGVPSASPFGPLRLAAEAALPGEPAEVVGRLSRASAAQRAFAIGRLGGSASTTPMLARLIEAERRGPGALFALLTRQAAALPAVDVRNACFDLSPQIPDSIPLFEKSFGKLAEAEKTRIFALAAEAKQDWKRAETHWRAAAGHYANDGSREGKLSAGVIYRHLAELARKEPMIVGDRSFTDPVVSYLRKSLDCDPDYFPVVLQLIKQYREDGDDKKWHVLADEAAQRFPTESAALLQAIESAAARKAYKRRRGSRNGFWPSTPSTGRRAGAWSSCRSRTLASRCDRSVLDLAWKELVAAGEWERADAPNADLRINQALVGLRGGLDPQAEARLREGVDLAGGGTVGWFRAALQDAMMTAPQDRPLAPIDNELARILRGVAAKPEIVAVAALLSAEDVRADQKATGELCWKFGNWLRKATRTALPVVEFHSVADAILRAQLYDVLGEFAVAGKRREPNESFWRFYEILARTRSDPARMYVAEENDIDEMYKSRAIAKDRLGRSRIDRYLDGTGDNANSKRRARRREALEEARSLDLLERLLGSFMDSTSPQEVKRLLKSQGRNGAVAALADRLGELPLGAGAPRLLLELAAETVIFAALVEKPLTF